MCACVSTFKCISIYSMCTFKYEIIYCNIFEYKKKDDFLKRNIKR